VHPDAQSRHSTCRRSVVLALTIHPITPSHGLTTPCAAARLVIRSHWLYISHAVRHNYLSRGNTSSTSSTLCATVTSSFGRIASTTHLD
jgi:hypothetical protein